MRHLVEDFFAQSWAMKAVIGWGWLAVLIMLLSFAQPYLPS
jgi:hypothetical protein